MVVFNRCSARLRSPVDGLFGWWKQRAGYRRVRCLGRDPNWLEPTDELSRQLRLLCRDEVSLIAQRTLLVNQLQQALVEYSPAALEAFDDWVNLSAWDFVLQFPTPEALAGAGPHKSKVRWACDKFLRHTVHLRADCFRHTSAWGQAYYQKKRADEKPHACALRCLGQRLRAIVFRMITDKKPYAAELHAGNQQQDGSWVLKLTNPAVAAPCE